MDVVPVVAVIEEGGLSFILFAVMVVAIYVTMLFIAAK